MTEPYILEIKGNSLDDGPGIRSAVFFKGCPLHCVWCHNPESIDNEPELSYDRENCLGCGTCLSACPRGALDLTNPCLVNKEKCNCCFACTSVCPTKGLSAVGHKMPREEVLRKLLSDKPFYDVSEGGVTLSGGEATLHAEWVGLLARELRERNISVLLETCAMFDYRRIAENMLPYLNIIYTDLKLFDREQHKKYCGVPNDIILANIRRLWEERSRYGYEMLIRTPLIPGITDTDDNLAKIADFLKSMGVQKTQLLPYNPTWYGKVEKLQKKVDEHVQNLKQWQTAEQLEHAKRIYHDRNIKC